MDKIAYREEKWNGLGPKIIIISDITSRKWSIHIAITADDELRLIGYNARRFAFRYRSFIEWTTIYATTPMISDDTYWGKCDPCMLVGLDKYGQYDRARWCLFICPVTYPNASTNVRSLERQFEDNGTFTLVGDTVDDVIAVITSVDAATVVTDPVTEQREICVD